MTLDERIKDTRKMCREKTDEYLARNKEKILKQKKGCYEKNKEIEDKQALQDKQK